MNLKADLLVFDIFLISNIHYSLDYIPRFVDSLSPSSFALEVYVGAKKTD